MECMQSFNESKVPDHPIPMIINDSLVEKFKKELEVAETSHSAEGNIRAIKRKLDACCYLKEYVTGRNLPFDFVIVQTSMFNSNFSKKHLGDVLIAFGKGEKVKVKKLHEVCNILKSDSSDKDFYYLFYRRKEPTKTGSGKIEDIEQFCRGLYNAVILSDNNVQK